MLTVHKATKSFGGIKAVDQVDLDIQPGEIAGLIGPNGAGKTTLFNLITGLYRLDEGTITWQDRPIHHLPSHKIAEAGIARTFQNLRLFGDLTVLQNVMIAQHCRTSAGLLAAVFKLRSYRKEELAIKQTAMELLHMVGLSDVADIPARDLSYGNQRRLEVARALALKPSLLLLDEPAAGMNETESKSLMNLVRQIQAQLGITVLLIEHDMRFVMGLCDRITVLNFGRRLAHGTPKEIQENPEVIAAYLGTDDPDDDQGKADGRETHREEKAGREAQQPGVDNDAAS